jgi:hypothetical protein
MRGVEKPRQAVNGARIVMVLCKQLRRGGYQRNDKVELTADIERREKM